MSKRLELQAELEALLGSSNVYFQPPESLKMKFPAIVFSRTGIEYKRADDDIYTGDTKYSVSIITKDPDFPLVEEFCKHFRFCRHDRHYESKGYNYDVYILYY